VKGLLFPGTELRKNTVGKSALPVTNVCNKCTLIEEKIMPQMHIVDAYNANLEAKHFETISW
jgi:hypothetical protein